jgi:hypothetical protein
MNAMRRIGRSTRQSLFVPLNTLRIAIQDGWAEHESASKERVIAFAPKLLRSYVEQLLAVQREIGWPTTRF